MTSLLLPGGITPKYEADEDGFRKTVGGPFVRCLIIQSRSIHLKEDREVEPPFPTVSLLTQDARLHAELQTEQLAPLWCHTLLFGMVMLQAIIFLCVSGDCNFQNLVGKNEVGVESR